MSKRMLFLVIVSILIIMGTYVNSRADDTIFYDGLESGLGNWQVDNGIWDLGIAPMAGPVNPYSGYFCVATVPNGNYDTYQDSRLISPNIQLPTVSNGEEIWLKFWQWFSYAEADIGYVQISVWSASTSTWSAWANISDGVLDVSSGWSIGGVDLTLYAGSLVRVAFYHTANKTNSIYDSSESTGWYIDEISIVRKVPQFTGDFEAGWGDWIATRGVWQVGGFSTHGGLQGVETVISGNYPVYTDSRLVSPTVTLPNLSAGEELWMKYWESFSYSEADVGYVQISQWNTGTSSWSAWTTLSGGVADVSGGWSRAGVDLTQYAGSRVRIAFFHSANKTNSIYDSSESSGWGIDDIEFVRKFPEFTGGFENGWGDWTASRGVWQVGEFNTYNGTQGANTVIGGNYPVYTDSRLVSPTVILQSVITGEELWLKFWQRFSFSEADMGSVQITVWNPGTSTWSAWTTLSGGMVDVSGGWSRAGVDLTQYAGSRVRIAFLHSANKTNSIYDSSESTGWDIDDIEFVKRLPEFTGDFECGWDDWTASNGVWQVGTATAGPAYAYGGTKLAGTVITGNYPVYTDSRLVSPAIRLSSTSPLSLTFQHWFSFAEADAGNVQLSVLDENTQTWSTWSTVSGPYQGVSGVWSRPPAVDLTSYAGRKVRIAFYHTANKTNSIYDSSESSGWYIDFIRISGINGLCECDITKDGRCDMRDWLVFGRRWGAVDCSTSNPCACDLTNDSRCDMRDWLRFGEGWGRTNCQRCQ